MKTRPAIIPSGAPPFSLLALILIGVFAVTRLPFFWYYPSVGLSLDSQTYLDVVNTMKAGMWPHFIFRTPGYPLFIWMVTACVDRWLAVVFVQNILSLGSALCVVYSVYRLRRRLALAAALAMCGFIGSSQVMFYDVSLLSDSLYTSMVILFVASLIMAFAAGRVPWFAAASALMGMAILVRPAGAYFVVIYAAILVYLLWNRCGRGATLGFLIPFPALLLALCAYNKATLGQFVISPFVEANIAGATALFWEPDPRLPPVANKALEGLPDSFAKMGITPEDLHLVRTSWDVHPLFDVYSKAYNRLVWSAGWGSGTRFGAGDYLHNRIYIREVSLMAIRRHPVLYAKYVWVNLVMFFEGIGYSFDLEASLASRATNRSAGDTAVTAGDATVLHRVSTGQRQEASAPEACLEGLERLWQSLHGVIYQNVLWSWAYFAVLIASLARLAASGCRHRGALLLSVLTLIPLGAGLVVCLVEEAFDRYSYPTQFVYYLSVALIPLLWESSAAAPPAPAAPAE